MKEYYRDDFDLDEVLKERGVKTTGVIRFARRANSTWIDIPLMIATGVEDGPILLVDACHHGDEYEGTEGIIKVFNAIDISKLKGSLVCIPAINTEAFNEMRRYGTQDMVPQDMNRVYPGSDKGYHTNVLAKFYYEHFVEKCTALITIHGGGNNLYLTPICDYFAVGNEASRISREMAEAFSLEMLWRIDETNTGMGFLDDYSITRNIPVILPEIGGQVTRLELRDKNIDLLYRGIFNVMRYFKMIDEPVQVYVEKEKELHVLVEFIYTKHGGIHKPQKKGGEFVKKGETLAIITDLFGNEVDRTIAPYDCVIVGYWAYSVAYPGGWSYMLGRIKDV